MARIKDCIVTEKLNEFGFKPYDVEPSASSGDCAFSLGGPCLWNRLPESVRSATSLKIFKSLLKTHLFKIAFQDL